MDKPEPTPPNCRVGKVTFRDGSKLRCEISRRWKALAPKFWNGPTFDDCETALAWLRKRGYGPAATGATS